LKNKSDKNFSSKIKKISAESIPSGSRHPLDSPPPRYVSVVALNELEKFEKEKFSNSKHRDSTETTDESGLPTYEEAVMRQVNIFFPHFNFK
jgi:hypothetical protein